jgi:hypothetical protein
MTTFTKIPVDLVVVDSGPLITLSIAGELRLLQKFRRPIRILDVAKAECTRFRDKPGANELAAWFVEQEGRDYSTIKTPGHLARHLEAVAKEDAGDTNRPSQGIGDEAITWYLANVSKIEQGRDVVLVLLEDAPFGDGVLSTQNPEVAVVSTRAFLRTLQNFGLIESADAIVQRVEENSGGIRKVAAGQVGAECANGLERATPVRRRRIGRRHVRWAPRWSLGLNDRSRVFI